MTMQLQNIWNKTTGPRRINSLGPSSAVSCPGANITCLLPHAGGPMDFSQVSVPLMTPPVSPAALAHRGSVINQGPTAGRPLTSCSFSSSSCLSSLGVMTQHAPCPSYQETLYHCSPQTSSSYFPPVSGSSTLNGQAALRSDLFTTGAVSAS